MKQRRLGKDGPLVGAVGLGCMSFGGIYGPTDMAESHATLKRALDLGVTHLDTANIYGAGVAEEVMGAFFRANGHRDRFTIATKGGIDNGPPREFRNERRYLADCLDGSLRRLGLDHVELYYVHRRDPRVPLEDLMETLAGFVRAGKVGAVGLSEIAPSTLAQAAALFPVAAVQSEYSLWTRLPELGLVKRCEEVGAAFVSFSPVGRGILSDTPPDPARFSQADFRRANPRFVEPNFSANLAAIAGLRAIAADLGVATATLAIAWTLAKAPNSIAIPGTRTPAHLEENAAAADLVLTPETMARIEAALPAGFAHGPRYSETQAIGAENYC